MAIKYFNGRIMNHDSKRPTIGAICYKCNKDFTFNSSSQYELINIKVNHGAYDSYVLKNLKTGKTTTSVKIAIDYTVRINKHFEPINSDLSDRKKLNLDEIGETFDSAYRYLYESDDIEMMRNAAFTFDACMSDTAFNQLACQFANHRHDLMTSDRECAAFILALRWLFVPEIIVSK